MRKVISGLLSFSMCIFVFSWWVSKTLNNSSKITFVEKKIAKPENKVFEGRTIDLIDHNKQMCEIHGFPLENEKMGISYHSSRGYRLVNGKKIPISNYSPNDKKFPYSNKFVYGGDCPFGEPVYALVAFCSKCRDVETHLRSK